MSTSRKGSPRTAPRPLWATVIQTAQGHAAVAASAYGIVACNWGMESEHHAVQVLEGSLRPLLLGKAFDKPQWVAGDGGLPPHLAAARVALVKHAEGDSRAVQDLAMDNRGRTQFTGEVLRAVQAIPPGQIASYGEVAKRAGRPGAARAVGQIMGNNPLAPLVPCHRVIAAGGKPGGFGPGLARKIEMLAAEGVRMTSGGIFVAEESK